MKANISDDHLFHEKIRKYEKLVIEYFQEMKTGGGKEQSANHVLAYLTLHNKLTQDQIQKLSFLYYKKGKKVGMSKGTISTLLNRYLERGIVKKERINGKKSTFLYSVEADLKLMLISIQISVYRGSLKDTRILEELLFFLQQNKNIEKTKKIFIQQRIMSLIKYLKLLTDSVRNIIPEDTKKKVELGIKQKKNDYISDSLVTSDLIEVERLFVNIYCDSELLIRYNRRVAKILGYFIIKKKQTQTMLRKNTNLSSGTISQGIALLIKENLVKKVKIVGIREPYYTMEKVYEPLLNRWIKMVSYNLEWAPRFRNAVSELETNSADYQHFTGYETMLLKGKQFLEIVPLYEQILTKLQEGLPEQKDE